MTLAVRDTRLRELMDDPDCDLERLHATLRRFSVVNRLVSGWGAVYRSTVAPYLRGLGRPARVLDLGCGGGDVIARLASLARREGIVAEWRGVDPDERSLAVARRYAAPGIRFEATDSSALRAAGERFDLVISNHVLHHLDPIAFATFRDDSRALSLGLVLHGDIARGRLAYGLYAAGITPLAPGSFLRTDGLRSIRRSFTAPELADALGSGWRVEQPAPFRVLAVSEGGDA
ncbi:methyltransferase domain-containing protein [Microbacterium invictum]|uniref:Methyltransferase domain-containing protein n=1 Tax=Microbacterium invictum TaxID=515415 RepID=A0ABZ0VBQ5_9MICO|nr:methyltransferase domain-containing protein [Microbacterium invictum]WQB70232.1 methyltransferase domain-containing protein [Microbacterium invictum]